MINAQIIKPDLSFYFNAMPFIGCYMAKAYNQANTVEDMSNLCHKWLNDADTTTNEVKKTNYKAAAHYLYALITKKSLDSNTFKQL